MLNTSAEVKMGYIVFSKRLDSRYIHKEIKIHKCIHWEQQIFV